MTCHAGMAGQNSAFLFSDSQGSTHDEEAHGYQKQYIGSDYLLGYAGSVAIGFAAFEWLSEADDHDSQTLPALLQQFVNEELRPAAYDSIQFIFALHKNGSPVIQTYMPGTYLKPASPKGFGTIGSGSTFVYRMHQHDARAGIAANGTAPIDILVAMERLTRAADQSLTVDSQYMLGMLWGGRSYVTGDADLGIRYAHPKLIESWPAASAHYNEMMGLLQAIRGETQEAFRQFSKIRHETLSQSDLASMSTANESILQLRQDLSHRAAQFTNWYDDLLGRPRLK